MTPGGSYLQQVHDLQSHHVTRRKAMLDCLHRSTARRHSRISVGVLLALAAVGIASCASRTRHPLAMEADLKTVAGSFASDLGHNTESYDRIVENSFKSPVQDPLSTFSIDVDTASYSNVRRFLN